jgi:hypothetical protein
MGDDVVVGHRITVGGDEESGTPEWLHAASFGQIRQAELAEEPLERRALRERRLISVTLVRPARRP